MLKELQTVNDKFISILKTTNGVLGAWTFGSIMHGLSDEYSDIDLIILADVDEFYKLDDNLTHTLKCVCDEILLCWPEEFNSDSIRNYGFLVKLDGQIFQYDIFLLNNKFLDDYICQIHYMDLQEKDIVFDVDNNVKKLIQNAPKGTVWSADIKRIVDTYWFHVHMSVKYLMRKDFFKLNDVLRILMDAHTSLLLNEYDTITWGGSANKLHFIPDEKQRHLMKYGCIEDFKLLRENLLASINWFEEDSKEIAGDELECSKEIANQIKEYWIQHTNF
jgi:predicted nucleotidyltransferase